MSSKQINQLPSGTANANAVVAADNADLTVTEKITLGDIAKLGPGLSGSFNLYVDGGRSDSYTADGSATRPFKTIQAAVDYAPTVLAPWVNSGNLQVQVYRGVVVNIAPYRYEEDVVVNYPRIHLRGTHPNSNTSQFCGFRSLTINSTVDCGGTNNNNYVVSGLMLVGDPDLGTQANLLTVAGNIGARVMLARCKLYSEAAYQCLRITNTVNHSIWVDGVDFNNRTGNVATIEKTTAVGSLIIENSGITCGNATAIVFPGGSMTVRNTSLAGAGDNLVSIAGSGSLTLDKSSLTATKSNATGIVLANTVTCVAIQNIFNVPAGSGYAVAGPAGTNFVHTFNSFAPGSNNSVQSGVAATPFSTTLA